MGEGDADHIGDQKERVEGGRGLALLDADVGRPIHGDPVRDCLLGEVRVQSCRPNSVTDLSAPIEDPVGWWGGAWHVLHAHGTKIKKL